MKHANTKSMAWTIISGILLLLAHGAVALFVILSRRYYDLSFKLFMSLIGVLVCLLLIMDIIFFVAVNHRDKPLKAAVTVLAVILLGVSGAGSYYVHKINKSVDNLIDNDTEEQYETINGAFVTYDDPSITSLKDLAEKRVGVLNETTVGSSTIAKEILEKEGLEVTYIPFNTMDDLLLGLVEENVDAGVFPSSYRQKFSSDPEADYSIYMDKITEFHTFEEKVLTSENKSINLDISTEPFNILLIGFAPEDVNNTYGLADTIMIATVNPKAMEVTLSSIARDSFVPISCYGGATDKINAARGTSRACLIETVKNTMDVDIDFYMEVNFQGVVDIVDALGGILINSPVDFLGQTPSANRGGYTVWVSKGWSLADGEHALAFARERHAMPNGDFDRQKHQQEVIKAIADKMIESKDINVALKALEAAGNNFSTNLSLSQMTSIFNYIINVRNYSGLPLSSLIDIHNERVTGYDSWHFNYSMRLKLWIYKLYKGSIAENRANIEHVLQTMSIDEVNDEVHDPNNRYMRSFKYFTDWPYFRPYYFHEYWNEPEEHEVMPDLVPNMLYLTISEAQKKAAAENLKLAFEYIGPNDEGYNDSQLGLVVAQNVRSGELVSEYPVVTVTVMGDFTPKVVPTFDSDHVNNYKQWATENVNGYEIVEVTGYEGFDKIGDFAGVSPKRGEEMMAGETLTIYVVGELVPPVCGTLNVYESTPGGGHAITYPTPENGCKFKVEPVANDGYEFIGWTEGYGEGTLLGEDSYLSVSAAFEQLIPCEDGSYHRISEGCPVPIDPDPNPDVPQDVTPPTE